MVEEGSMRCNDLHYFSHIALLGVVVPQQLRATCELLMGVTGISVIRGSQRTPRHTGGWCRMLPHEGVMTFAAQISVETL